MIKGLVSVNNNNQECIDYKRYDTSYIEEGDLLIW